MAIDFVREKVVGISETGVSSKTSWYEALSSLTFPEETAFGRIRLIRKAFSGGMTGHWITGFGLNDLGWGLEVSGKPNTDLVNSVYRNPVSYGLLGLVPFLGIITTAFKRLHESFIQAREEQDRWFVWSLMSTLVAMLISLMSVSLYGQTVTAFFLMLAFCANSPTLVTFGGDQVNCIQRYTIACQKLGTKMYCLRCC